MESVMHIAFHACLDAFEEHAGGFWWVASRIGCHIEPFNFVSLGSISRQLTVLQESLKFEGGLNTITTCKDVNRSRVPRFGVTV